MDQFTINLNQIGGAYQQGDWEHIDAIYNRARARITQGSPVVLYRDTANGSSITVRVYEQLSELEEWIQHMEEEYGLTEPYLL